MNDRYLFRAKRIDNGEWVIGNLIDSPDGRNAILETSGDWLLNEVDPSTICQCTGLKDKNGKLIWENDIVAYWDTYSTESGYAEADCIGKVLWDDETASFQVTERLSAESYEVLEDCKVLGNTIDNPELLEVGE